MKKFAIIAVVLAVAGLGAYWVFLRTADEDPNLIPVSGNIEVTDAEVSFKMPGRVSTRAVDEGQFVQMDDLIATLDDAELKSELALRQAELQATESALAELVAGSRPEEIAAAKAAMDQAQALVDELVAGSREQEVKAAEAKFAATLANVQHLKNDLDRALTLVRSNAISQGELDFKQGLYDVAVAEQSAASENLQLIKEGPRVEKIAQARAALAQVTAQFDLVLTGPRKETIQQAIARTEQAKAGVQLARTKLENAILKSPLTGIVLSKNTEPGEFVAAGTPVVTVGDLENVWLRAYINETDLGRVKIGQVVHVTTDTYPDKRYDGRVSFVSSEAEFTPKNVQTSQERVKLVYRIKVDITNINMELKPGMPADAIIEIE
ncbi:MAG: HlyD family efflux transporter periplasmic adaptor subunit [Pirellulaceae bacterium]|jgi:HlyD family secretion protein|nr:HlyD family efflux transporter periplasmic adaptor subunit [Pirellulaceae bacterium]